MPTLPSLDATTKKRFNARVLKANDALACCLDAAARTTKDLLGIANALENLWRSGIDFGPNTGPATGYAPSPGRFIGTLPSLGGVVAPSLPSRVPLPPGWPGSSSPSVEPGRTLGPAQQWVEEIGLAIDMGFSDSKALSAAQPQVSTCLRAVARRVARRVRQDKDCEACIESKLLGQSRPKKTEVGKYRTRR